MNDFLKQFENFEIDEVARRKRILQNINVMEMCLFGYTAYKFQELGKITELESKLREALSRREDVDSLDLRELLEFYNIIRSSENQVASLLMKFYNKVAEGLTVSETIRNLREEIKSMEVSKGDENDENKAERIAKIKKMLLDEINKRMLKEKDKNGKSKNNI